MSTDFDFDEIVHSKHLFQGQTINLEYCKSVFQWVYEKIPNKIKIVTRQLMVCLS